MRFGYGTYMWLSEKLLRAQSAGVEESGVCGDILGGCGNRDYISFCARPKSVDLPRRCSILALVEVNNYLSRQRVCISRGRESHDWPPNRRLPTSIVRPTIFISLWISNI